MKYSVVVLACVLAVAAAVEYKSGQYIPERKSISQIKPYRYQQSRPYVSSTPFPGLFVSSTPVPVTFAPARSTIYYASSTPRPVFNIPAIPARSLSVEPVKPVVESAKASWSAPVEVTTIAPVASVDSDLPSWSARASWPTVSSESSKIDLPVAPTQAALAASVSPSVAPTLAAWSGPTEISAIASASPSVASELPSWTGRASWPAVSSESSQSEILIAPTQASVFASPSVAPIVSEIKTPVVSVVPAARLAAVRVTPVAPVFSVTPVAPIYQQAKIALPAARYAGEARAAETLRYNNQINSDGAFQYSYETNNGIVAEEQGVPRSFYSGNDAVAPIVAQGSFGWTSPEGQQITISYVADETGYHATGSAIPEMPPQIARALEYIAARNLHA